MGERRRRTGLVEVGPGSRNPGEASRSKSGPDLASPMVLERTPEGSSQDPAL